MRRRPVGPPPGDLERIFAEGEVSLLRGVEPGGVVLLWGYGRG